MYIHNYAFCSCAYVGAGKGHQQHMSKLHNNADTRRPLGMCSIELYFSNGKILGLANSLMHNLPMCHKGLGPGTEYGRLLVKFPRHLRALIKGSV